jgi:hypothetical protein
VYTLSYLMGLNCWACEISLWWANQMLLLFPNCRIIVVIFLKWMYELLCLAIIASSIRSRHLFVVLCLQSKKMPLCFHDLHLQFVHTLLLLSIVYLVGAAVTTGHFLWIAFSCNLPDWGQGLNLLLAHGEFSDFLLLLEQCGKISFTFAPQHALRQMLNILTGMLRLLVSALSSSRLLTTLTGLDQVPKHNWLRFLSLLDDIKSLSHIKHLHLDKLEIDLVCIVSDIEVLQGLLLLFEVLEWT